MNIKAELPNILSQRLGATPDDIAAFCQRWQIVEFALFGSVIREDFQADSSDVDVLVQFAPGTKHGLDEWIEMEEVLEKLFGRSVDLVDKEAIQASRNWIRKRNILESAQVLYDR